MNRSGPLKWFGGKSYLADRIRFEMPKHTTYHEPYFGGGAVLLAASGESVSEVVNDIDGDLTNFWRVLQDRAKFGKMSSMLSMTPYSEEEFNTAKRITEHRDGFDEVQRAAAFFVLARQSFSAGLQDWSAPSKGRTRRGMCDQVSAWLSAVDMLPEFHARMRRVAITSIDGAESIRRNDGPVTFHYCDPPYMHETRTGPRYYKHEMTDTHHAELLCELSRVKGKFILSGYPSEMYLAAERQYKWKRIDILIDNKTSGGSEKRIMTECLWKNY
jgi:DNA adenine methylase